MEVFLTRTLKFEPITIMPLGDIQSGVASCDMDLLAENVQKGMEAGAYFIGMGDYIDCASPSNRAALKSARLYDTIYSTMDEAVGRQMRDLMEIIAPTKGRWFGMLTGHHVWEFQDGTTSDTRLCDELQTTHLGDAAMIKLHFADSKKELDCIIWAHHGEGSGTTVAAPLNKLEKVIEWAEADLYLMGHQHKRVAANVPRFYIVEETLVARERVVVCTGSYLKGYMQGSKAGPRAGGTYVEKGMMRPVSLGSPMIRLIPQRKRIGNVDVCLMKFETIT